MNNLNRIQYLSRNYTVLQGLKNLPIWGLFLLIGVGTFLQPRSEALATAALLIFFVSIVAAPILYIRIQNYYSERFGYVKTRPDNKYTALLVVGVIIDTQLHPPVSVFSLFATLYCLHNWREAPTLRRHYLFFAVIMGVLSLMMIFIAPVDRVSVILIVSSLINLACGVLDHLLLMQLLRQTQDEPSYANSI
jgi:hypothetical protein